MDTKLDKFSEMANVLSEKSSIQTNLMTLFGRFGLGHILSRLSLEKQEGVSATQLILSLCLFRVCGESIYSIYKKGYYDLVETGKNCYCRMMNRESMDWRKLLTHMAVRFQSAIRKEGATSVSNAPRCLILDDTTLEKTGLSMEHISRVFDHVEGRCVLGYKLMLCAFFDGKSTIPMDFSLHCEKGKNKNFGLSAKQLKNRFTKKRSDSNPNAQRANEAEMSKLDVAIDMVKRAWKSPALRAQYVLCDSLFTCEKLVEAVRNISNGSMHFVGLAKNGNTKYCVHGKKRTAAELIAMYERQNAHDCRRYKCRYISLLGELGSQPVRIFLIRYGKNKSWNVLLTSNTSLSFVQAFEIYQIRWNIEVLNKECKQYLKLGSYQGRDFDGQIADCTICFMTYMVMALEKRFSDYETMGELFSGMEEDVMALTLWRRILSCLQKLMEVLCECLGLTFDELASRILCNDKEASKYLLIVKALETYSLAS